MNNKFFNVDYDALRKFRKKTENNISQCTTELETLHTAVNKLAELKNFKGLTAKHMKAYYNDVYGLIIEAINDIFEMYSSVFCLYQNRLMRQVDSDEHARLSREAMYYLEQDISNTAKRLDEEVDEVNSILRGIADIHASTQLDFDNFLSEKKKLVSYMDRKIDKVYEVDNNISGNEITILMKAIKATQSVIETYADVTRKIEQYQPSSYGKESSVLNLGEAFYEIQKYYEKNSEEIFAAAKQQRKIDEELGITEAKEEQAEKRQNSFFSSVLSFVPVAGDVKDIQETVMGMDVVTGEKLGTKERIFTGICIVLPVVNGKVFRVGGDAAKTVKAGKVVSKVTASVPIAIKITKEESGIMKLMVKKADESGSKIVKAIENSKAQKIGDDGAEILGKKVTKEAIESGKNVRFNVPPELELHIKNRDMSVPRKRGIGGAHNSKEFFKNDVEIVSEIPSKIPGIKTVEYKMPKLNPDGTPTGEYGAKVFKKTIYDPDIISDEEFINRGIEAANNAVTKSDDGIMPREWSGVDSKGITWHGYFEDGNITSFFPEE